MKNALLLILIIGIVNVFSQTNPNTAISGTSDYFLRFNDRTTNVALSNPEMYDKIGEDFTIEMWFRKTVGPGEYRPLISKHPQTPGVITDVDNGLTEFLVEVQYDDGLNFFSGCGSYSKYGYYVAIDQKKTVPYLNKYTVIRNRWTHVAVTVDWRQDTTGIPTGVAKIYADGILVDAAIWAAVSPSCNGRKRIRQPGVPIRLGYFDNQDQGFQQWIGDIDELRIWSVVRSEQEIKSYYNGGIPLDSVGIVSYHTFSEASGDFSNNVLLDTLGFPRVNSIANMFTASDLKISPNTAVTCPGLTINGQPVANTQVDIYITKIVQNTDAKILWSDYRDARIRNVRRQITSADLPLNIGPEFISNIIEYLPGTVAGVDIIYYEARNNGSFPEPSGPASLTFETRCCGSSVADSCRVCNGNNTDCSVSCDGKGGVYDECGVCGGNGLSCRGCDGIPFSSAKYDMCGVCGGNSACYGTCNGVLDQCGICNGNNSCCAYYKGVPKDRVDHILLDYTLDEIISKLEAAKSFIESSQVFVSEHNRYYRREEYWNPLFVDFPSDLPSSLSNRIISMNHLCSKTDQFISKLDEFLTPYGYETRIPWPPLQFLFNITEN